MDNNDNNIGKEHNCDCMVDVEYDTFPKIYRVAFRVYGVDSTGVNHLVVEVDDANIIGLDVDDIISQIKKDHINSEFNEHDGVGMSHIIGQRVVVHSVRYMGLLNHITTKAKNVFEIEDDEIDDD